MVVPGGVRSSGRPKTSSAPDQPVDEQSRLFCDGRAEDRFLYGAYSILSRTKRRKKLG